MDDVFMSAIAAIVQAGVYENSQTTETFVGSFLRYNAFYVWHTTTRNLPMKHSTITKSTLVAADHAWAHDDYHETRVKVMNGT